MAFRIKAGVKCKVRKSGEAEWRPFVTTRDLVFLAHGLADNGGCWTFRKGEWELKVATSFVTGRKPKERPARGCFGTSKGKGSSRRRNMRVTKGKCIRP